MTMSASKPLLPPEGAPAEDSVDELDDESGERSGLIQARPNFGDARPGQITMSWPWVNRSRIRWDKIPSLTARPSDQADERSRPLGHARGVALCQLFEILASREPAEDSETPATPPAKERRTRVRRQFIPPWRKQFTCRSL